MGRIIRVKVNWTGFVGSPGYTNLFFEPADEAAPIDQAAVDVATSKVQTFLTTMKTYLPSVVTVQVDPAIAELDEVTGDLQAFWSTTTAIPSQVGAIAGNFSAGVGFCISWGTDGVRNSRRVRGRTFIAPLAGSQYDATGSLQDGALASWRTAATALRDTGSNAHLVVYSRPGGTIIPDGGAYKVTSSNIADRVAYLSSRRS